MGGYCVLVGEQNWFRPLCEALRVPHLEGWARLCWSIVSVEKDGIVATLAKASERGSTAAMALERASNVDTRTTN